MDNIATISDNSLYRIGDCILNDNGIFEQIVQNGAKFDKTFLYTYCIHMKPAINKSRFSIPAKTLDTEYKILGAAKIAADFIRSRRFALPPKDALVVHMRLGDCYSNDSVVVNWAKKLIPNKTQILNDISKYNNKKIIIVTAYNNHTNDTSQIESNNNKSQFFLDDLIKNIPAKYEVSIRSSTNVDADFIYLCAAKDLLLTSKSLFGTLAQKIGKHLRKIAH